MSLTFDSRCRLALTEFAEKVFFGAFSKSALETLIKSTKRFVGRLACRGRC